ncbi:MAG: hypothetical protein AB1489_04795 [Acidobacteriota bacterium]
MNLKKQRVGFSTIELLIALAILLILISLAVIAGAPMRRAVKTDDAARTLYTLMRQGRLQAITRRQFYALVINTANTDQTLTLNNSERRLSFLAQSITLVDMGRISVRNDEEITLVKQLPLSVIINDSSIVTATRSIFLQPERSFTVHDFASINTFVCYFDPAGRAVNLADDTGTQEYRTFFFSSNDINVSKSPTLLRAITLYGATGGLKFWRYIPAPTPARWTAQID